ncbi:MAG TPA: DUF1549 and DUF1553 domain-containing protein, partial [Verrucomicrobiae bacterium]|nr:DUF1549 and DUF1553 domain-containing protein [Verrucomicrobiae bacterium]
MPPTKKSDWIRTPIDGFVLARLEKEGLTPSPEADRVTLIRRLSLDLIGLPPSIKEVELFVTDQSPSAYEALVERLLNSPHYGERWGRHWLDAARYADSDGYEKDKSRQVWFYRDWVVNAFNRDLPYDQFVLEQLAGDELPHPTQDQIVATGFLRNSMLNEEGGIDPEQFRMEAMFDRMDAIGKSMLGLTIQCAQCHDHKFDPLTQAEYYQLFAFLNNDHEANAVVYRPSELMTLEKLRRERREIEDALKHRRPDWPERMANWEQEVSGPQPEWVVLTPEEYVDPGGGAKYSLLADNSILCAGYAPTKMTTRVSAHTSLTNISAVRLEVLTDPNLPRRGPGRSYKGTFGLTEFKLEAASSQNAKQKSAIKFSAASADYNQPPRPLDANFYDKSTNSRVTGPVSFALDGNNNTAWDIDAGAGRRNQDRQAIFSVATNFGYPGGTKLTFQLLQNHGGWNSDDHMNNLLGRLRLSVTASPEPVRADPWPRSVRAILKIPRNQRTAAQQDELFSHWRTTVAEFAPENAALEELWKQWPEGTSALTLESRQKSRSTRMLKRGDWLKPDEAVVAGVPSFLHPLPSNAPPTRLTLGRWMADRRNPTLARVLVNRVWQAYFGTGLVSTPEDLGLQSEMPSHPELLDWLACEFMNRQWKIKELHRLILTSAVYRQSSHGTEKLLSQDPYNRLLARGSRLRVEGEIVHDIALAASGLLNPTVGGPPVFPPIPQFLVAPPVSYAPFTWKEENGADRYRRALYTFRRRSTPHPVLQTFDVPNADFSCVRRNRSNTPLQALTTLNEVLFVEAAQALALRTLQEGGKSDRDLARYAFQRCLSRKPTPEEEEELLIFLHRQRERIAEGWVKPWDLAARDPEHPPALPAGVSPTKLAAWT